MAAKTKMVSSQRPVDHLTDELVAVLGDGKAYDFRALFDKVFEAIKLKKLISGGEEMLRLRSYEKLLVLAKRGFVLKTGRTFQGLARLPEATSAFRQAAAAAKAAGPAA